LFLGVRSDLHDPVTRRPSSPCIRLPDAPYRVRVHTSQYPAPRHVVAHLSDTHLLAGGKRQFDRVDPEPGLLQALERLGHLAAPPQAIVVTGDLADLGEPAAYARLRELVEPAATRLGARLVWVMGNHDDRAAYATCLFDDGGPAPTEPQDRVYDVAGLRVVALDSTVPGYHHGELREAQLDWLREVLAVPAPYGTLLAMHHPPQPLPLEEASTAIELFGQERLAPVLAGSDVRAILAGHMHYSSWSTFAGIPVSVASASCYTMDLMAADRYSSSVDGAQAISMVHLYDEGAGGVPGAPVVHTVVPLATSPEVAAYPLSVRAELARLSPEERHELLSRKR
jgi:3',5'-cyclic-AMP phosphodiesterase